MYTHKLNIAKHQRDSRTIVEMLVQTYTKELHSLVPKQPKTCALRVAE